MRLPAVTLVGALMIDALRSAEAVTPLVKTLVLFGRKLSVLTEVMTAVEASVGVK